MSSALTALNVGRFASVLGAYTSLTCLTGAGHPGEEDIGGLVLVSPSTPLLSFFPLVTLPISWQGQHKS